MKRIVLSLITIHLSLVTALAQADLSDPRLEGLDLEYYGETVTKPQTGKASVYYDLTYFRLFASHEKGWLGGDGVYTTTLPDGNSFWSFGDSFFGLATEFRINGRPTNLPRNAAMIQTGEDSWRDFVVLNEYCSTNPNDRDRYYKGKTWLRHSGTKFTQSQINNGENENDHFYWPGDGAVIKRDGKPIFQLIMGAIHGEMVGDGRVVAEYSLEGKPGDPGYMKLLRVVDSAGKDVTNNSDIDYWPAGYGSGVIEGDDGHIYLYGSVGTGFLGAYAIVARTQEFDLTSTWEYYVKKPTGEWVWQTEVPTTAQMQESNISNNEWISNPSVFKYGNRYYMCTQIMLNSPIYIYQASRPWGPFINRKELYKIPETHNVTYNCFIHPQFSRTGELVISYNMNPGDSYTYTKKSDGTYEEHANNGFWRNFNAWGSSDLYQPHFIRVFGWQNLFRIKNTGPTTDVGIEIYNQLDN
ncbi:MAG: DUF5005 domain-containing protein [Prevotella sp.]|nr:DUF5005 domain-containing protein [Prevotella sp.]